MIYSSNDAFPPFQHAFGFNRLIATEHKLGLAVDVKLLFGIIGAIYDYNPNIATCMKDDMWKK